MVTFDSLCSPNTEGANRKLLEVFEDLSQEDGVSKSPSSSSQNELVFCRAP